jgi:hypothetical protein
MQGSASENNEQLLDEFHHCVTTLVSYSEVFQQLFQKTIKMYYNKNLSEPLLHHKQRSILCSTKTFLAGVVAKSKMAIIEKHSY